MSMPLAQQPPVVTTVTQQSYNTPHSNHGSAGPVIAVLLVVIILGVLAGMIGRLCSGKRIMGYGQYDIESWAERKFSSCIDGTISPPPPRHNISEDNVSTPTPTTIHQEQGQERQEHSSSSNQPTHL